MKNTINIKNKKARFDYEILDTYVAGIKLAGTEIKAIRDGKASITESFCEFNAKEELFVINMTIQEAKQILAENGRSTCSCKYGGDEGRMIEEAIRIKESQEKK